MAEQSERKFKKQTSCELKSTQATDAHGRSQHQMSRSAFKRKSSTLLRVLVITHCLHMFVRAKSKRKCIRKGRS